MQLDAKRNFFSIFSGYLHLPVLAPRFQTDIPDFYGPQKSEQDPDGPPLPPTPPAEPDDLVVGRSPLPPALEPDPWDGHQLHAAVRPITPFNARLPTLPIKPQPIDPPTYSHGSPEGLPADHHTIVLHRELRIKVDYKDGDGSLDLRLNQVNDLHDNDVGSTQYQTLHDNDVVTEGGASTVPWPHHDVVPMSELAQAAEAWAPPNPYAGDTDTPESVVGAMRARGDSSDGTGPDTLHEGVTIDGVKVASDAATPTGPGDLVPTAPVESHSFEHPTNAAVIETGGNSVGNHAAVIDEQGAIGTMLVMGNSYQSDAIIQTNILIDHSAVAGTAEWPTSRPAATRPTTSPSSSRRSTSRIPTRWATSAA
ncbi:hypothetical protein [Reyranella soli]|uniref:Uncharacterized protein n=1 Tax=Reyranella soli TaxID=1230389 RepID=A0A512N6S9_9HYPH|nr:hypothetical protein [Reyranella soli]GEP54690.1 hypothetical protein RSO01_18560 [Reyranella soli]